MTQLVIVADTTKELQEKVDLTIVKLIKYMENKLHLNQDKINYMVSSKRIDERSQVRITVEDKILQPPGSLKVQGITLTDDLKMTKHVVGSSESLVNSLATRVSALEQLFKVAPRKTVKIAASAIITSTIHYAAPLWASAPAFATNRVQILQNRAMRTFVYPDTHTLASAKLLEKADWLTTNEITEMTKINLVHQAAVTGGQNT